MDVPATIAVIFARAIRAGSTVSLKVMFMPTARWSRDFIMVKKIFFPDVETSFELLSVEQKMMSESFIVPTGRVRGS